MAHFKRANGYNVLHPMGWDAFGLPAEQYALKTNTHPSITTAKNIATFKKQMLMLGLSYDWSKEVATSDPNYYKWTQFIFTKLYEKGLAYQAEIMVNWCPSLGTVLANEEVVNGRSEVGDYEVVRKPLKQWVLKITEFGDRLLEDLTDLNWPTSTLEMQKNWIGKSQGTNITFKVDKSDYSFEVFTTRADTLFGCTYVVLAPEHPLVLKLISPKIKAQVVDYINTTKAKSERNRLETANDKTGVKLTKKAINPINGKKVDIYIADYVLSGYGTGAVMAVPAHDERDYEFAKLHNIKMIKVVDGDISSQAYTEDGIHINSEFANGTKITEAKRLITDKLIETGSGSYKTQFKLRDWIFSRQRFWGEPIPILETKDGKKICLGLESLPLVLPNMERFEPSGDGQSPLANAKDWVNTTYDNQPVQRETNTMPQWAGSCWYFIRYLDPFNQKQIADPELIKHWLPVDLYIGGAEHAVMHLLYARFWFKVLYDCDLVYIKEPFKRLFHQGMILGDNNEKMSKSRGNVINPDSICAEFGSDTLRVYEMFMGPLDASLPWSTKGIEGSRRFLERVYRLITDSEYQQKISKEVTEDTLEHIYHKTLEKVTKDIELLHFNTAIAQLMSFVNELYKAPSIKAEYIDNLIIILHPFAPHLCEEMYQLRGYKTSLAYVEWPKYDESKLVEASITYVLQVNGKLRGKLEVNAEVDSNTITQQGKEIVASFLANKEIVKVIFVNNKLINYVVK
jgi:leucyl-tRNA synthetase